jgi:hypothetical protein
LYEFDDKILFDKLKAITEILYSCDISKTSSCDISIEYQCFQLSTVAEPGK